MCRKVILLFGPTGVGKTGLLTKIFTDNFEIISADSIQIYKHMDIGTAKPDKGILKKLTHHLVDIIEPDEPFSAGDFVRMADRYVVEITERGCLPVLCGGTAFYLKNFLYGLTRAPVAEPAVRAGIRERHKREGNAVLFEELKKIDPEYCRKISVNDTQRILRALEVYEQTGRPLSSFTLPRKYREEYNPLLLGLRRPRRELRERIDRRVDKMFETGLEDEYRLLRKRGYGFSDPGLKAIGYREFSLLDEGYSVEDVREAVKTSTRAYAKRQMTFFNALPDVHWFYAEDYDPVKKEIENFLEI